MEDLNHIRKFIKDQVAAVINSANDKFWVYMENLGYMEVSHNKISLDLLYDMYDEGKKD